jgi:hypothetical protein
MKARVKGEKCGRTLFSDTVKFLQELILSEKFLERARRRDTDFTRNRKMGFSQLIVFMINLVRTSTQTALDRFFELIGAPDTHMTQQSFSESRQKLLPEACRELLLSVTQSVYANAVDRWHGMVVIAVDGSKVQLPDDKRLLKAFGGIGPEADSPTAQVSIAYDMFNAIVVDAEIEPLSVSEHELACRHIDQVADTPGIEKALLIFDRGYSSSKLMAQAEEKGIKFLVRVRRKFNLRIDALGHGIHDFALAYGKSWLKVRVIKFVLLNGETETLVTNLLDERMGIKAFKQLYFMRWPVETKYGEIKLKLEVENFSGRTEIAVRQDFYITMMLSNVIAVARQEAQPVVERAREEKDNKYRYKVNVNHAIGTFKDRFIRALVEPNEEKRKMKLAEIIQLLCKHVVPERKERSISRNPFPRKAKFHHNMKSNC